MSITKDQYYRTLLTARDQLRKEGFPCPKIEEKHILLVDERYQFALDLDMREERVYRSALLRLDEIICEMLDIPNEPLEPGFWIHYGENFSREIPECWKTKSKLENATKTFDINGNETDKYNTYSEPQKKLATIKIVEKKIETEEKTQKDMTYTTKKFPDTYSL